MAKAIKPCPGWLATFADLMSLLMAVFVLLFAMSTLDANKYEALVESLTDSLGHGKDMTQSQVQYFDKVKEAQQSSDSSETGETVVEDLKPLFESLIETYATQTHEDDIKINFDPEKNQIKVSFAENIAFETGQVKLKPNLIFQLRKLKVYITPDIFVMAVGHTDSRPIKGGPFVSNWGLSSMRAAMVVDRMVQDKIVLPTHLEAVGMADTQPVSQEKTNEGYAKNRRVELLLMPLGLRD